jgi:hypothetical protein
LRFSRVSAAQLVDLPGQRVEVGLALRDHRVLLVVPDLGERRPERLWGDEADLGDARHEVARDDGHRVGAHRSSLVGANRDPDPVDVLRQQLVVLDAADLEAAHVDVGAQLQAVERLPLEVDRVVVEVGARSGPVQPDDPGHQRSHQEDQRQPDIRVLGFGFHFGSILGRLDAGIAEDRRAHEPTVVRTEK